MQINLQINILTYRESSLFGKKGGKDKSFPLLYTGVLKCVKFFIP